MAQSKALIIIIKVSERLKQIKVSNGFNTDAGNNVFITRSDFSSGDPGGFPLLNLQRDVSQNDSSLDSDYIVTMRLRVEGWHIPGNSDKFEKDEELIADIKQAVLLEDDFDLKDGVNGPLLTTRLEFTGAAPGLMLNGSQFNGVVVNLSLPYIERYGKPNG